ncbi:MAG: type I-E CRISPR-associated protein Cas6/Cse3/CasE [Anaerolineales bacterium]
MLYLSRLLLNPRERQVQSELARPYQMHRTLLHAFPDPLPANERVLFRVDWLAHDTLPVLLVQSRHQPRWQALPNPRYLLPAADLPWDFTTPWDVKPCEPAFQRGQTLRFRLQANPTVKRAGKRHPLTREADQSAWLQRKLQAAGARLLQAERRELGRRVDAKHEDEQSHRITLYGVRFDGLLQVTDPQALAQAVGSGIGSAKGLGFGLLSLAPA